MKYLKTYKKSWYKRNSNIISDEDIKNEILDSMIHLFDNGFRLRLHHGLHIAENDLDGIQIISEDIKFMLVKYNRIDFPVDEVVDDIEFMINYLSSKGIRFNHVIFKYKGNHIDNSSSIRGLERIKDNNERESYLIDEIEFSFYKRMNYLQSRKLTH